MKCSAINYFEWKVGIEILHIIHMQTVQELEKERAIHLFFAAGYTDVNSIFSIQNLFMHFWQVIMKIYSL